ncbi:DUF998 domain-containing protein [Antrihabitans cavernicola]|uniref:DUF998 domain-containing protein n=1 Tax=Antrihabitans cavernicola TaxID=2495913 RepID=A0A5A7SHD8_9NOCA|nr:DUF998 domain-containing protein [Spelaeibacter cavernicola]KAA0024572.1 DUF998 domain-containing protein [Spelaeibacter cavernicola]
MSKSARAVLAVAIAVAGIAYSSWLLEFVLHTGLDPTNSFLSELDAVGQPYREVFSYADTLTGTLAVLASIVGIVFLPRRPLITTGWIALLIFGASTIADARLPITCIPTPVHPCGGTPSGLFPQLHHIHALTSTIAVFAIFTAMIAFSWAAYRYRAWPVLRVVGLAMLVICAVTTAWMLIADNLPGDYALGVAQRVQVGTMSLWIVTLGIAVWRTPTSARLR